MGENPKVIGLDVPKEKPKHKILFSVSELVEPSSIEQEIKKAVELADFAKETITFFHHYPPLGGNILLGIDAGSDPKQVLSEYNHCLGQIEEDILAKAGFGRGEVNITSPTEQSRIRDN